MRKQQLILIVIAVLVAVLTACGGSDLPDKESTVKEERKELVLAIGGETEDGFDPTTGWGQYGSPLFQSTIFKYDKDFNLVNDLATDFTVSEDGLTYTIDIREDVVFSDELPLTAEDIVFTFETAQTSGSVIDLTNLEKVEATDEFTVTFTLKKPASSFTTLLVTTGIVPKHLYDDTYNVNPVGSGPYVLVEWIEDQQLIVEKNKHYYGDESVFEQLTFLFLAEDAAFAAAKAGEVDVVAITPSFAGQAVKGMKQIEIDTVDNRGIVFPYVKAGETNVDGLAIGNDVTADRAIRKAIDVAVDRAALVDGILEGYGTPAYSVADHLPWWNEETVINDADLEAANDILTDGGWELNADGILEKDGLVASFDLLYPAGDEIRQSLSLAVADQVKELGIEINTAGKSWNDLGDLMFSNAVMMGWGSHDPLEMYNIYSGSTRGDGFYNTNYYKNDVVDAYMEKAMRATSQDEANDYWKKAQWDGVTGFSSLGDTPWAWLVNVQHIYLINENLELGDIKLHPHGHGWPVTDFIEQWHWKE